MIISLCLLMSAAEPFSRSAWLDDYASLKTALERSYSHLAWLASPGSGVDLVQLDARTLRALQSAETKDDGAAAIEGFMLALHDGHVAKVQEAWGGENVEPPKADLPLDAQQGCALLRFAPVSKVPFSLPFESLRGFTISTDGISNPFRSGIIDVNGKRFGLLRISQFSVDDSVAVCLQAWRQLAKPDKAPPRGTLRELAREIWLEMLAERLAFFTKQNVRALLIDVGGNPGGDDSGDWAVRLITSRDVSSAPLLMIRGAPASKYFAEQTQAMSKALEDASGDAALKRMRDEFQARKSEPVTCDLSWVWKERRAFKPSCALVDAGFASGPLAFHVSAAESLYWPAIANKWRGAYNGAVFVITDTKTASAAEMFTALAVDARVATTVGQATAGLGCGFMAKTPPVVLPNSKLAWKLPNCVRLRADGSDEVAGIAPNIAILPFEKESPRARSLRLLDAVSQSLR